MQQTWITILVSIASASALVIRDDTCCFHLTAYGGPGGPVGQLGDGQNRIGDGSLPGGQYCLSGDGITDGKGRGCILTPPTTQWQCDAGAKPTGGFAIGGNGTITHDSGENTFFACPTGDNGGWNIYSSTLDGEPNCAPIWLVADNCLPPPPPPPSPPPSNKCPADLPSYFEFPHLIVKTDSASADQSYGNSYFGTAGGTVSSIFNFDIPSSLQGKQCKFEFLFPQQSQLETSSYTFSGSGSYSFDLLSAPATSGTSSESAPSIKQHLGDASLSPGNAYNIGQVPCPAGAAIGIEMSGPTGGSLTWFQDYNPCPIGMYLTVA